MTLTPGPYIPIPGTTHIALAADQWITPACLHFGRLDWDRSLLDVPEVSAALRPGAVAIDVGAYIGDTTRLMLDRGCSVIAFEPQPDAFHCLKRNCPDADCRKLPVGDGATVLMQESDGGNLGARQVWAERVPDGRGFHDSAPMPTFRLDDLGLDACAFVKIDVEGFEPWVLDGMRQTLARCRPILFVELSPVGLADHGRRPQDIADRLSAAGYCWRAINPDRVPHDWLCMPGGTA